MESLVNLLNELLIINISLSDNSIDDDCMKDLGELLQMNKYIIMIDISYPSKSESGISDKGIEILTKYLKGNEILKELHLDQNNKITEKSIPFLKEMIINSRIEIVECNNIPLGEISSSLAINQMKNGNDLSVMKKLFDMSKKFKITFPINPTDNISIPLSDIPDSGLDG